MIFLSREGLTLEPIPAGSRKPVVPYRDTVDLTSLGCDRHWASRVLGLVRETTSRVFPKDSTRSGTEFPFSKMEFGECFIQESWMDQHGLFFQFRLNSLDKNEKNITLAKQLLATFLQLVSEGSPSVGQEIVYHDEELHVWAAFAMFGHKDSIGD